MLDKEIMTDSITELSQDKKFNNEVAKSKLCKSVIKNLCEVNKCTNVPMLAGIFTTGISSLCTMAGYMSQNIELCEQMGDIAKYGFLFTGATLGVKYLSKTFTEVFIYKRSCHEERVLNHVRNKYVDKKCEKENINFYSKSGREVNRQFYHDVSDYAYDNMKEFDVYDFVKDDLDSSEM